MPRFPPGLRGAPAVPAGEQHSLGDQLPPSAQRLGFPGLANPRDRRLNPELPSELKTLKNDFMCFLNSTKTTACRKLNQGKNISYFIFQCSCLFFLPHTS